MSVLAGGGGGQPIDIPCVYFLENLLKADGGDVVTLVHNDHAVILDQRPDLISADEGL